MRAVVITRDSALEMRDYPKPVPGPDELLIKVKAAGLNRADLYQRRGTYNQTAPHATESALLVAGMEAAGVIEDLGSNVSGFSIGQRVMGICTGGYAEYITLDFRLALPAPDAFGWTEAAATPLACMTAYNAIVMNACLKRGESVLVNAASSGVGIFALQIAGLFGAKPAIAVSTSSSKLSALKDLGVEVCIEYDRDNFADAVHEATQGKGIDIIIDHLGGPFFEENVRCMAVKGRIVSVGRLAGASAPIDLDLLALKRLRIMGVTFRTRTLEEKIDIVNGVKADLFSFFKNGSLRPVIDKVFELEEASKAQSYMTSNAHIGKIVLRI